MWLDRNIKPGKFSWIDVFKLMWTKQPPELLNMDSRRKYGPLYGINTFGQTAIICSQPEIIGQILSKEFTSFTNRRKMALNIDPMVDNMLQMVYDDQWKRLRAIVSPTFSTGKLRKMRPLIDDCLKTLMHNMDKLSAADAGHVVDLKTVYGAFSMEVIIQVAFGTKVDALIDDNNPIIVMAKKLMSQSFSIKMMPKIILLMMAPKLGKLFGLSLFPKDITNFFADLVHKIIAERRSVTDGPKRYDFLQLLLDANDRQNETNDEISTNDQTIGDKNNKTVIDEQPIQLHTKSMSDIEMVSQCVLFFMAGYDTTATTISYAAYLLAENPDCQQRLYNESKTIFESQSDIDYDTIERLEYLNAILMESLRQYPPALSIERQASNTVTLQNNGDYIKIFKDDIIEIPTYVLHMDEQLWPEPQKFNPDRFIGSNITHHPYSHLPFGAGPRNCVAKRLALMEAKLAILYTVYNYRLEISDKTHRPPERDSNLALIIPKEVLIKVEKRIH